MNEDRLNDLIRMKEQSVAVAFPALMRKVYIWMALALTITGFTAYGVASSPGIVAALFSSRLPILVLCAAELILVLTVSARIQRLSLTTATIITSFDQRFVGQINYKFTGIFYHFIRIT